MQTLVSLFGPALQLACSNLSTTIPAELCTDTQAVALAALLSSSLQYDRV